MILVITEYEWKLEETLEDGSAVLDIIPTVGAKLPVRISISAATREKLIDKLSEGKIGLKITNVVPAEVWPGALNG